MKQLNFGSTNGVKNDPNKTVVHCPEEWQVDKVFDITGEHWRNTVKLSNYKNATCIQVGVGYHTTDFYKNKGYTILTAEEFIRLNTEVENPFKVGDRVYCILNGWGEITTIEEDSEVPISVKFDNGEYGLYYRTGRYYPTSQPTLSFTPYTLQGFSQERPKPDIKEGQLIYVRDIKADWIMRYFSHWRGDIAYCFYGQKKEGGSSGWKEYSLTNPLEEK